MAVLAMYFQVAVWRANTAGAMRTFAAPFRSPQFPIPGRNRDFPTSRDPGKSGIGAKSRSKNSRSWPNQQSGFSWPNRGGTGWPGESGSAGSAIGAKSGVSPRSRPNRGRGTSRFFWPNGQVGTVRSGPGPGEFERGLSATRRFSATVPDHPQTAPASVAHGRRVDDNPEPAPRRPGK
jgi:hypothetical protein